VNRPAPGDVHPVAQPSEGRYQPPGYSSSAFVPPYAHRLTFRTSHRSPRTLATFAQKSSAHSAARPDACPRPSRAARGLVCPLHVVTILVDRLGVVFLAIISRTYLPSPTSLGPSPPHSSDIILRPCPGIASAGQTRSSAAPAAVLPGSSPAPV